MNKPVNPLEIPLTGKLVNSVDGILIGQNFKSLKNLRYTSTNPKGVRGMTKINTTVLPNLNVKNGFHFRKEQPEESHIVVQANGASSIVYQNTTSIPDQGNFTAIHTDATGAGYGRFSETPTGMLAYCNGKESLVWGGDEYRNTGFVVYDPGGSFKYVHTDKMQNTLSDTDNTAILYSIPAGVDSNVVLLLHLENNVTDSSITTPHTVTNNNVTFSGAIKKFGSYSAVFNGTTAYLSIPDDADFDFSGGSFCIDRWVRVANLQVNPIYYHSTTVKSLAFTSGGTYEPSVGDSVLGETGGATGTITAITLSSGTWAAGDAAGTLYIKDQTGVFQAEELTINGNTLNATISSDSSATTDDFVNLSVQADGSVTFVVHTADGGDIISLASSASEISVGSFYHIEVDENDNNFYLFIDGVRKDYDSTSERLKDYDNDVLIGYDGSNFFDGYLDEDRVSNVYRHTTNFEPLVSAYTSSSSPVYIYLGSVLPIDGFKIYMKSVNTNTSTMSVDYWDGTSYTGVSNLVDGTSSGGISLAQTGSVTFDDTSSFVKLKVLDQAVIYWYRLTISDVNTGTSAYYATVSIPMQPIKDLWDGYFRTCIKFFIYKSSTYNENTNNITEEDYTTANDATYSQVGSLTSSQYLLCGFIEKQLGLNITIIGGHVNTTAGTTMSVYYWNGTAWVAVDGLSDGTSEGSVSFSKSGLVSWTGVDINSEFKKEISKEEPLFYYKIVFDQTLSSDVRIDFISGIPAQEKIDTYKFPFHSQDRLWLCANQAGAKNSARCSATYTTNVFNGDDSIEIFFGGDSELTAAASLYSQFGSSLYDVMVFTKASETWVITGQNPDTWIKYPASKKIGCVAPLTMQTAHVEGEIAPGLNRNIAIWQGTNGIYLFDGRVPLPIDRDIDIYFDRSYADSINLDKLKDSVAFFNEDGTEYHWLFASGTSTTLNKELVFDVSKYKWFEIDRGTKSLQCGFPVTSSYGVHYTYGASDNGYVYRLEDGTSFDGDPIAYELGLADLAFSGTTISTELREILLFSKSKKNSDKITVTHNGNTSESGKTFEMDHYSLGHRVVINDKDKSYGNYVFHSLTFNTINNNETIGFEPLHVSLGFKQTRRE